MARSGHHARPAVDEVGPVRDQHHRARLPLAAEGLAIRLVAGPALPAIDAQKRLPELNQISRDQTTYYSGAWFRYGFHEDGFMSAVNLCRDLLGEEPW